MFVRNLGSEHETLPRNGVDRRPGDRSVQYEERPKNDDDSINLRGAQYVRMSTEHQRYSTQIRQTRSPNTPLELSP